MLSIFERCLNLNLEKKCPKKKKRNKKKTFILSFWFFLSCTAVAHCIMGKLASGSRSSRFWLGSRDSFVCCCSWSVRWCHRQRVSHTPSFLLLLHYCWYYFCCYYSPGEHHSFFFFYYLSSHRSNHTRFIKIQNNTYGLKSLKTYISNHAWTIRPSSSYLS